MKQNHEIRFGCSKEEIETAKRLRESVARDVTLTGFYRRVFLMGISGLSKEIIKNKNEDVLIKLFGGKR